MHVSPTPPLSLLLASTSRYRRDLLGRLNLPFEAIAPQVDEAAWAHETPLATCVRLAHAKAMAVARQHPEAVVIGSDQVADYQGQALSKPGHHEAAVAQLQAMRGQTVVFHTALCVLRLATGFVHQDVAHVRTTFRTLSDAHIERYLRLEQPYDCAGSAKSEALGIALMSSIESDDPTALVGLPLIRCAHALRLAGLDPLDMP
jgi:septum formation protein